ncbi:glutathione-disulfide reductase [Aromatoleum sp.]|uniref:glutathione-disulfide reductase n=1 Tax=Aromatoleum sp. TaxID=2307007 RepID=UPI002FC9CB20
MTDFDVQLFVIGAGSGGVRAARVAAGLGARVAIAEERRLGGTCVSRGCIPKKLLAYAAHYREDFEDAAGFGWSVAQPTFSWERLVGNKNREIDRLNGVYRELLEGARVDILQGGAKLADAHTVSVDGRMVTAEHVLVATGGRPFKPDLPGIEHAITSDEAFELRELPRHILLIGGGYIAVEFAGIFNGLGADVTLAYRGEQILRGFDDDIRRHLNAEMRKMGVAILLETDLAGIVRRDDGALDVEWSRGSGRPDVFDTVMFATGRKPNTEGLGLAELGVKLDDDGGIVVDDWQQTNVPGIHAVGDVTNRIALTPVAIREGFAVAATLFGGRRTRVDYDNLPSAVFSQPPIATVGLTEAQALKRFDEVDIYRSDFRPLRHTLSGRDGRSLVKLVVETASQRVVGAHMAGADAPEIIQGIAIAVKMGAKKSDVDATIGIHPTAAEEFVTLREKETKRRHDDVDAAPGERKR